MNNKKFYLGIDLGSSAVKGILRNKNGEILKAKESYTENTPLGLKAALKALLKQLHPYFENSLCAIGLSSQVGTYVINGEHMIPWSSGEATEELDLIKKLIPSEIFEAEICMPHPSLCSYPLPRLMYIQKKFGPDCEVLMPKELIIRELTGAMATDIFSMRGIANIKKNEYSLPLTEKLGINIKLPALKSPTSLAGYVSAKASAEFLLPENTPVYTGCNDFFAGLLGMGVYEPGTAFELSGTSEHIGYIGKEINRSAFVSGPYFNAFCSYGGTKSSGLCCDFAMKSFGIEGIALSPELIRNSPIFLPYLNGERAPIFDNNARGVYFGLNTQTDKSHLAYSVLEGVVFSLYHIATGMKMPPPKKLICGGGSTRNELMNKLRATVFNCDIVPALENDSSALGACMLAMLGDKFYSDYSEAIADCVSYGKTESPDPIYTDILRKRFNIYSDLYPNLKSSFKKISQIQEIKL